MTNKRKDQIKVIIAQLARQQKLTATEFFTAARATKWGASSETLISDYNESLGSMMARGELSMDEAMRGMQP